MAHVKPEDGSVWLTVIQRGERENGWAQIS